MADDTKGKEVPMADPAVSQHKQIAAGVKLDGQKLPQGGDTKTSTKENV